MIKFKNQLFLTFFTLLFLGLTTLNAQILNRGNFIIGGTFGFSGADSDIEQTLSGEQSVERATTSQLNVAPSIGYFFSDNFVLGFGLDYTLNSVDREDISKSVDSDLLFGPFTRYYFPAGSDKAFFIEANFGYGSSIDDVTLGNESQSISTNVFAIGVGPGFTIFSNDAIGIEASVKYNYARSNAEALINGQDFQILTTTNQFDFSVGFQFYFSRIARATTN